jgi:hypothetical protein
VEISLLCVGGAILFALVAGLIMRQLIQTGARESAGLTAAAYMTVLGSLFAILTGFLINTEYSTYRQAQNSVGSEVAAASELAYASASLPAADASLVQARLGTFLVTTSVQEWPHLAHDPEAPSPAAANVSQLSQVVRELKRSGYNPVTAVLGSREEHRLRRRATSHTAASPQVDSTQY